MNKEKEVICYGGLKGYGKTYCEMIRLQQENNQLKENNLAMQEEMCRTWEKLNIIKELRSWLESWIENEEYCYLATTPKDRCRKDVYQDVLSKLNELEEYNEKS